jgi:hypothetical protein
MRGRSDDGGRSRPEVRDDMRGNSPTSDNRPDIPGRAFLCSRGARRPLTERDLEIVADFARALRARAVQTSLEEVPRAPVPDHE